MITELENCTIESKFDEKTHNMIVEFVKTGSYGNGNYVLEDINEDYDCYDFEDDEQEMIDQVIEKIGLHHIDFYMLVDIFSDFKQNLGLVLVY